MEEANQARPPEAPAAEPGDVESLKRALEEEAAKAKEYLAGWQRAQADFQNLKRRNEQEKEEVRKFSNAMLILQLLSVLDDFERAFSSLPAGLAQVTWVDGVRLVYRKLQAVLESNGLSEIQAVGQPFDPNCHEAVHHHEGEEGMVLEEVQRGYRLHGRVIRPTLVVVGKGKQTREESSEVSQQEGG